LLTIFKPAPVRKVDPPQVASPVETRIENDVTQERSDSYEISKQADYISCNSEKTEINQEVPKLFVGGISYNSAEEDVRSLFEEQGRIADFFMPKDKETDNVIIKTILANTVSTKDLLL
jgi:RNA recognition motif-containing protein